MKICQGLRPKFNNIKVPPLLENLIDQCLDADPLKRPSANELHSILDSWYDDYVKDAEFRKQCREAENFNQSKVTSQSNIISSSYTTHPQAIYTSRLLDFKNLPEPQNSKEINIQKYSGNYF